MYTIYIYIIYIKNDIKKLIKKVTKEAEIDSPSVRNSSEFPSKINTTRIFFLYYLIRQINTTIVPINKKNTFEKYSFILV